jgi:hypothetical protein
MYSELKTTKLGLEQDFIPDHPERKESIIGPIKRANKSV